MVTVKITPTKKGDRSGKLAGVELHFTNAQLVCPACEGHRETPTTLPDGSVRIDLCGRCHGAGSLPSPLAGLKLIGFSISERSRISPRSRSGAVASSIGRSTGRLASPPFARNCLVRERDRASAPTLLSAAYRQFHAYSILC